MSNRAERAACVSQVLTHCEALARAQAPPRSLFGRVQNAAEMWIYALNERQHWFFHLYDGMNRLFASLFLAGVRKRARAFTRELPVRGASLELRALRAADLDAFSTLLAAFDLTYSPPHRLDRESAAGVLRHRHMLPFGIFEREQLVGYVLLRLFFPRRIVSGIWLLPEYREKGIAVAAVRATGEFTRAEALPDYVTVPVDNEPSLMGAQAAGWRIVRSNRRFHVLLR